MSARRSPTPKSPQCTPPSTSPKRTASNAYVGGSEYATSWSACGRSATGKNGAENGWKSHGNDHESAASREPKRKMIPRVKIASARPKSANTMNMSVRLMSPTSSTWKPKKCAESHMPNVRSRTALMHPEAKSAVTYSLTDSGAMNMLLRLRDQIFHMLPTATEYEVMPIICQSSIPRKTNCEAFVSAPPAR